MHRYFIQLSYNGTSFNGWQSQENAISVQSTINKCISDILQKKIVVTGCGRTDAGVHARDFYAHFDTDSDIFDCNNLTFKMNGYLAEDIAIKKIFPVDSTVNARFSAISRTYTYYISIVKNPFNKEFAYYFSPILNIEKMNQAATTLLEYTDFTSFSKLHTQTKTNNCKITEAFWKQENEQLIFTITANRFLRNMVRAIVGTLMDIGKDKITIEDFRKIIISKNRSSAGFSVPAKGLFLEKIMYPSDLLYFKRL